MACLDTEKGKRHRDLLERIVNEAGVDGIDRNTLAERAYLSVPMVKWYVRRMPVIIRATPKRTDQMRLFHVDHRADCDAYVQRCDAAMGKPSTYCSEQARQRILQAIADAGARGASRPELVAATGLCLPTVRNGTKKLRDGDAVQDGPDIFSSTCQRRYYAPGFTVIQRVNRVKSTAARVYVTKPKPEKRAKPAAPVVLAKASKVWNSAGLKTGKKAPQIVVPAEVDYSRAKVTQCPSCHDMRHTVHKPEPFFSALAIGNYLPADTWTARVYGGAR